MRLVTSVLPAGVLAFLMHWLLTKYRPQSREGNQQLAGLLGVAVFLHFATAPTPVHRQADPNEAFRQNMKQSGAMYGTPTSHDIPRDTKEAERAARISARATSYRDDAHNNLVYQMDTRKGRTGVRSRYYQARNEYYQIPTLTG